MSDEQKPEESKSARDMVKFMNDMKAQVDALTKRQCELEGENENLKQEVKEVRSNKVNARVSNTTLGRHATGKINTENPPPGPAPVLVDEPAFKGYDYKHDACPFCNETNTHNIVDQTPAGSRYSCRVCAKCWSPWMLFKKYDKYFEGIVSEQEYFQVKLANSALEQALNR